MKSGFRFAFALLATTAFVVPSCLPAFAGNLKTPVAKPLSAWLVGPSQASVFDAKDHPEDAGCLMVTEFDNHMIVGMHARAAGVVGMTVDTKVQNLDAGDVQNVGFNIGPDAYVMVATATDESTLALNLEEAGGGKAVVERLTKLGNFRLLIDEQPYYFATTGFTDGLARLQACMGSSMAVPVVVTGPGATNGKVVHDVGIETMKVTSSGHDTPLALAMPNLVPMGYKFVLEDVDPMTPLDWQAGDDWVVVMQNALTPHDLKMVIKDRTIRIIQRTGPDDPVIEGAQIIEDEAVAAQEDVSVDIPEGVWSGAKGANLADVLDAWGLMAGVNVKVDLMNDLTLPRAVRYEGPFDQAVQKLLAQFNGENHLNGSFHGVNTQPATPKAPAEDAAAPVPEKAEAPKSQWRPRPVSEIAPKKASLLSRFAPMKQMRTIPDPPNAPKVVDKNGKAVSSAAVSKTKKAKWEAMEGTSLRDALEHWGRDADVQLVWLAYENYPLPKTIQAGGTFEEVVMSALSQYEGQGARPVAQLNQDPDTGKKALIIKTKRAD